MPALYVSPRNVFDRDRYSLLNEVRMGEALKAEEKPAPALQGRHGRHNGFMLAAMKVEHAASTIGHDIEHAVKPDPMAKLKADLKQAPTGEAKAKILLSALKDVKDEKMSKEIISTGLETTKGSERAEMMATLIKGAPSADMMKNQLTEIAISKPELTSLKGVDLSKMNPKDVAILPLRHMEIAGSKFPADVKLSGNQAGLNLENVTAPGLDVRNTTGEIKAKGANVKGGAINATASLEERIKNAARFGPGADTGFRLADPKGNTITWSQANGKIAQAMMNSQNVASHKNTNAQSMGMTQAPHIAV